MNRYTVIKSIDQYNQYCDELERIVNQKSKSQTDEENIDLLTVLIEKWDQENSFSEKLLPVDMLKALMDMHGIKSAELSRVTGIDKTVLSKILNYKKGFSKAVIRILANYFKVDQEAFNTPYPLLEVKSNNPIKLRGSLQPVPKSDASFYEDYIRILPSKKTVSMAVTTYELISKEDQDIILYVPTLKLFGKGNTLELAKEQLELVVNEFLNNLMKLSSQKIAIELIRLGWKQNKYKSKNFSKSYVDGEGVLREFDHPVEDKVVRKKKELFSA